MAKKERKWTVAPRPGPHKKFESIPLQIVLRNIFGIVETGREAQKVVSLGEVLVDGKKRKDYAYPVGLFDVISIPKIKMFYRIIPVENGLRVVEIPESEAALKIFRVEDKKILKGKKMQLNLSGGKNILSEKNNYKTGDSLLIDVNSGKIVEHFSFAKNSLGVITSGENSGKLGKIKELIPGTAHSITKLICEIGDSEHEVSKTDFFVVGKTKPAITVMS